MSLNKSKGNMYGFVTHTWNPIKGKCPHECSYCYMNKMYKRYKWNPELRLDEKCLKDNLGEGNFIFVGSSTDMFAKIIPHDWISDVFTHCKEYNNTYLFQSKNPYKFFWFKRKFPKNTILATTIETNRQDIIDSYCNKNNISSLKDRIESMYKLNNKKMITIEPIMDFYIEEFLGILQEINPFQVNIGADSGHNKLPEPPKEKIEELITELKKFTTVHLKDNLQRLLK